MLDKLFKRYGSTQPEIILSWAQRCLGEFDRLNCNGKRNFNSATPVKTREAICIFLQAEAYYDSMKTSIKNNWIGLLERELRSFYSLVANWSFQTHDYCEEELKKLLPRQSAKTRIKDLIDKDPFWMNREIKEDLLELINKGTIRDPKRKGKSNA